MSYNPNFTGAGNVQSASKSSTDYTNNSGGALTKATPVRIDGSGDLETVDVTVEAEVDAVVGIVAADIPDSATGGIISSGRLEDITTTASFGSVLYISKTGTLTDVKPEIGVGSFVADDFVVKVGVVVKNNAVPSNKDLIVNMKIVGQL